MSDAPTPPPLNGRPGPDDPLTWRELIVRAIVMAVPALLLFGLSALMLEVMWWAPALSLIGALYGTFAALLAAIDAKEKAAGRDVPAREFPNLIIAVIGFWCVAASTIVASWPE